MQLRLFDRASVAIGAEYTMTTAELLEAKLYYADIKQLLDDAIVNEDEWQKQWTTISGWRFL